MTCSSRNGASSSSQSGEDARATGKHEEEARHGRMVTQPAACEVRCNDLVEPGQQTPAESHL